MASRRVFVDTSGYFALINADDVDHPWAIAVAARLAGGQRRLFTSNLILAETHALLLRRLGRDVAARFLASIDRGSTVVRVAAVDERRAREIIAKHDDKDDTLTDAASFAVMERLRIEEAFTLDRHFVQYGFSVPTMDED